ncbi:hypothetical protein [Escherichia coli]|uniref:hypothetical protein n=1 Tax=Escherichia coli TaxID=562 RepID=UPI003D817EF5
MNSTSYFYNHSSQWRYETVTAEELSVADGGINPAIPGHLIDFNGPCRTHGLAAVCAAVRPNR